MPIIPILVIFLLFFYTEPCYAYVGPGLGLGVVGVVIGLVFSVFLAIFSIFWYPIKKMLKKNKEKLKNP